MWILESCTWVVVKTLTAITYSVEGVYKIGKAIVTHPIILRIVEGGKTGVSLGKTIFIISHFFKYLEGQIGSINNLWRFGSTGVGMLFSGVTNFIVTKAANDNATKEKIHFKKHGIPGSFVFGLAGINGVISIPFVAGNNYSFALSLLKFSTSLTMSFINLFIKLNKEYVDDPESNLPWLEIAVIVIAASLSACATYSFITTDLLSCLENAEQLADAIDQRNFSCNKKALLATFVLGGLGTGTAPIFSWLSTGKTLTNLHINDFDINCFGVNFTFPNRLTLRSISSVSSGIGYAFTKSFSIYHSLTKNHSDQHIKQNCCNSIYTSVGKFFITGNSITVIPASVFVSATDMIDDLSSFSRYDTPVIISAALIAISSGLGDRSFNINKFVQNQENKARRQSYIAPLQDTQHHGFFSPSRVIEFDVEENAHSNGYDGNKEESGEKEMKPLPSNGDHDCEDEDIRVVYIRQRNLDEDYPDDTSNGRSLLAP